MRVFCGKTALLNLYDDNGAEHVGLVGRSRQAPPDVDDLIGDQIVGAYDGSNRRHLAFDLEGRVAGSVFEDLVHQRSIRK